MYLLKELIQIEKRFQNSINLHLDLEKDEKLNHYIPTRSSLAILEAYLENIVISNKEKATILIGPYGKGKSHLLLVLLRLLSERDPKKMDPLLHQIQEVNPRVDALARQFLQTGKPYLPIVISSTNSDLNQAFLIGLTDALKKNHLEQMIPDTYYSESQKLICMWKKDYPSTYEKLEQELRKRNIRFSEFEQQLSAMKPESYQLFQKLYTLLTAGGVFNPLVQTEMLTIYKSVCRQLCEEHHYAGMFLVFDEFSKYIEGHARDTFSRDMKIIQDMCELAASSKENPIHITFVAHKSIKEYGSQLPREMQNAFTGVEGRLKERLFVVSSQNNYELVQSVLHKKGTTYKTVMKRNQNWQDILEKSYQLPCFQKSFDEEYFKTVIASGCYPLLPMTTYLLLSISEKVAQNERSVFTFLANSEKGTLAWLVDQGEAGTHGIAGDMVYDYFENLFRENMSQTQVHAEWLKADYALTMVEDQAERTLIKCLALLLMIRNSEDVPANSTTLRLTAGLEEGQFQTAIKHLLEQKLILKRQKIGLYAFKNNVGVDLDQEIQTLVAKQSPKLLYNELLPELSDLGYVLPKQHNQTYTMTRYFQYIFLTVPQFLAVTDAAYFFEEQKADGKIVALLFDHSEQRKEAQKQEMQLVAEHVKKLSDARIVVLYPQQALAQEKNIRKYLAIQELQRDEDFLENNKAMIQELKLYEEDIFFEINARLEELYYPENGQCQVLSCRNVPKQFTHAMDFNRFLSEICNEYYVHAPKVNNEQINRQKITSQVVRARNQIITRLLAGASFEDYESGTSPQATIFRATMLHTGIQTMENQSLSVDMGTQLVLEKMDDFIKSSAGKKQSFEILYHMLAGEKYGVRKGILPIFLARELSLLSDTPVIYLQEKEVELSAEILNNINEAPEDYYLYVELSTVEKESYLKKLEQAFQRTSESVGTDKNRRLSKLVEQMQQWYRSLPQYTIQFQNSKEVLRKKEATKMKKFRNLFRDMELNARDILFERIPVIFNCQDSFEACAGEALRMKDCMDHLFTSLEAEVILTIKACFGAKESDSLHGVLKEWFAQQSEEAKSYIKNEQITGFMNYLETLQTHDEQQIAARLAKIMTQIYLEDWTDGKVEQFCESLTAVKAEIEALQGSDVQDQAVLEGISKIVFTGSDGKAVEKLYESDVDDSTTYFLKNAIDGAIEEFGDSLEMNQKVAVLIQTLEEIIKN